MRPPITPEETREEEQYTPQEEAMQPCSSSSSEEEEPNNNTLVARASQCSVDTRSSGTSLATLKSATSTEFAAATPLQLKVSNRSTTKSSSDPLPLGVAGYPNSMIQPQQKQEAQERAATTAVEDDLAILDSIAPLPSGEPARRELSLPGAFAVMANGDRPSPANATNASTTNPSWHERTGGAGDVEDGTGTGPPSTDDDAKSVVEGNGGSPQLVEATPLSDSGSFVLPNAEEDTSDISTRQRAQKNARFYGAIIAALFFLLLAAGVVGYVLGQSSSNKDDGMMAAATTTPAATSPPSTDSTEALESPKDKALLALLADYLPASALQLLTSAQQEETSQYQAYQWVLQDPNLESYDDRRILQRFAAASLYYSTRGDSWTHQGGDPTISIPIGHPKKPDFLLNMTNTTAWLSYGNDNSTSSSNNECNWFSVPANTRDGTGLLCEGADGHSLVNLNLMFNGLNGTLPPQVGLLTKLEQLWVPRNPQLGGTLPTQLGRLDQLNTLITRGCAFGGSLPSELGRLSNTLTDFNAHRNQHTGTVPTRLWDMPRLEFLRLGHNRLTGSIPSQTDLPKLQVLRLARNKMTGSIPVSLAIQSPDLWQLDLAGNSFTGSMPSELGLLTDLVELELGGNQLTGTMPSQLGGLSQLAFLNVEENAAITGSLPSELGLLEHLESIHLKDNLGLTGSLPDEWRQLNKTLQSLDIQGTSMAGTIPEELCGIKSLVFDCSAILCGCRCPCLDVADNDIQSNSTPGQANNLF